MTLPDICALLGIFPRFRLEHGLDEVSLAFFAHVRRLLDRIAGICVPRSEAKGISINAQRLAAKDAIRTFEETRSWEDLLRAHTVCTDALREISLLAPANHAAAVSTVRAFEEIFSMQDGALRDLFDRTAQQAAGTLDSASGLMQLAAAMGNLLLEAQRAQKKNLRRYALSAELEFLRQVSQNTGNRAPFLLPDTTDAEEYFRQVQIWITNYTERREGQG